MHHRFLAAALLLAAFTSTAVVATAPQPAAAVSCTLTVKLAPGATGGPVTCLETRLVELGYAIGTPDATYDATTVNAVKDFQRSRGLYADGIVTSLTSRQLGLRGALPSGPSVAKVTVIGDSTAAGMRWYDEANNVTSIYDVMGNNYDLQWSVESCRRLVATSCVGRTDPGTGEKWQPVSALPLMQTTLKGRLGQALVIMAGYDDVSIGTAIDRIMTEAKAQGVARVFWLTYRVTSSYTYGAYYRAHNSALSAARAKYPNLIVLDWNSYTHSQSAATQDAWFEADDIHMTRTGSTALANYLATAIDASDTRSCTSGAAQGGVAPDPAGTAADPPATGGGFHPLTARVFDSRSADLGGGNGKIAGNRMVDLDLSGLLPSDAISAVLHVTAVSPCHAAHLVVYACGLLPPTSNLNYEIARTTVGLAISQLSAGHVCVHTAGTTDLVVDLEGWFGPGGDLFHPLPPVRWVDTRNGSGVAALSGTIPAGGAVTVPIAGTGDVPADATGAWLNVIAIAPGAGAGEIRVDAGPCPSSDSGTTSAWSWRFRAMATADIVGLGSDGSVCVRSLGSAMHVVIDLAGWFGGAASGGLEYHPVAPTRLLNTRTGAPPTAGATQTVAVPTVSVLGIIAIRSAGVAHVTAVPCGATGTSSVLNVAATETIANVAVVGPGSGGAACITPAATMHLVADRTGEFVAPPA